MGGTVCSIAVRRRDGVYVSNVINFDGYLSFVGRILHTRYKTEDCVLGLIGNNEIRTIHMTQPPEYYEQNDILYTDEFKPTEQYNYLFKDGKWFVSYYVSDENDQITEYDMMELTEDLISSCKTYTGNFE